MKVEEMIKLSENLITVRYDVDCGMIDFAKLNSLIVLLKLYLLNSFHLPFQITKFKFEMLPI